MSVCVMTAEPRRKRGSGTIQERQLPSGAMRYRARWSIDRVSKAGKWRVERDEAIRDLERARRTRKPQPCPCACGVVGFCDSHRELLKRIRAEFQITEKLRVVGNGQRVAA